jgi:hypothetical protein
MTTTGRVGGPYLAGLYFALELVSEVEWKPFGEQNLKQYAPQGPVFEFQELPDWTKQRGREHGGVQEVAISQ